MTQNDDQPKVAVSILCWRSYDRTRECIESVFASDYDNIHVILSNNGAGDTARVVEGFDDNRVTVIDNDRNIGFARGHNAAASVATELNADYVLFLNNDTVVAETCVSELVEAATGTEGPGLYAPKVLRTKDREANEKSLEFIAGYIDWTSGTPHSYGSELEANVKDTPRPLKQADIDYLHGAALFTDLTTFCDLDGFEERFFIFYEDADLGQRAKEAGVGLRPVEKAVVYHVKDGDQGMDVPAYENLWAYLSLRNKFWFMTRHADRWHLALFTFRYLFVLVPKRLGDGIVNRRRLGFVLGTVYGLLAAVTFSHFKEKTMIDRADEAVRQRIQNDVG